MCRTTFRRWIAGLMTVVLFTACTDAPTAPGPDASAALASQGVSVQEGRDAEGRVHRIERTQESRQVARVLWTVDGKVAGQLVAHYAKDGTLRRVTGRLDFAGTVADIDKTFGSEGPSTSVSAAYDDPCFWATIAFGAAAAILTSAVMAVPFSLPAFWEALAIYSAAAAYYEEKCSGH